MKVFLPAVMGFVPDEMVMCLGAFLNFCYVTHHSDFDETTLDDLDATLARFHLHREIFCTTGVHEENGFNLPHQHTLVHFCCNIEDFGTLNGICSSTSHHCSQEAMASVKSIRSPWSNVTHKPKA